MGTMGNPAGAPFYPNFYTKIAIPLFHFTNKTTSTGGIKSQLYFQLATVPITSLLVIEPGLA
jgi:hypothetical protein